MPDQSRHSRSDQLATERELSDFLIQSERRAFKQAAYAVRDDHAALDIVQDAMMKLAEKYSDRPAEELPLLFQRILQNVIRDYFRRHKVRAMWTTLMSSFSSGSDDENFDLLETLEVENESAYFENPATQLDRVKTLGVIEDALKELPARQREAFLLRYWEELDVADTASAMGCSEGSVKTHCSRAVHALAAKLAKKGVGL